MSKRSVWCHVLVCLFGVMCVSSAQAQDGDTAGLSAQQRAAIEQMQSNEATFQQYQIDQQLVQLDAQKWRDAKRDGAADSTLRSLQQTLDTARARLTVDGNQLFLQQQSSTVQQNEMLANRILPAMEQRKRSQQQQERRKQAQLQLQEQRALHAQETQERLQQQILQQQSMLAQQQNLLAAQQNSANQNVPYWDAGGGWFPGVLGYAPWWGGHGRGARSSGVPPMSDVPSMPSRTAH